MLSTHRGTSGCRDAGSALLITLVATVLLAALGLGLVGLTNTEARIASNVHAGHHTLYAADDGLEVALADVLRAPRWDDLISGLVQSPFLDATRRPSLPSGVSLDLNAITATIQAGANTLWGGAAPRWNLFASGRLAALPGGGAAADSAYAAVWVGDDPSDGDLDPLVDANGTIVLVGKAWGPHASMRTVTMTVERRADATATGGGIGPAGMRQRVVSWREVH